MKRIAVIFEYPSVNGGEHSMLGVIEQLHDQQFDFVAITPHQGAIVEELHNRKIPTVAWQLRDALGNRLPREIVCQNLLAAIDSAKCDVVHANSLAIGRLTGAVAKQLSIPCMTHVRDIIKLSGAAIADLNRNASIVAVSQATANFHTNQGVDGKKVHVCHNGVDCQKFQPRPSTGFLREELKMTGPVFLIATIGQIGLRKGQDVLAEAAAIAATELSSAHFLLIGERNSNKQESIEFEQNVRQRFLEGGWAGHFHELGYRQDIPALLNEVDLLVHPAHQEPLGRVLLEAAASGTTVLATDVGGTSEIFTNQVSAVLVPPRSPAELAQAMIELYNNPSRRQQLAHAARIRAETAFPLHKAAAALTEIWQQAN